MQAEGIGLHTCLQLSSFMFLNLLCSCKDGARNAKSALNQTRGAQG